MVRSYVSTHIPAILIIFSISIFFLLDQLSIFKRELGEYCMCMAFAVATCTSQMLDLGVGTVYLY